MLSPTDAPPPRSRPVRHEGADAVPAYVRDEPEWVFSRRPVSGWLARLTPRPPLVVSPAPAPRWADWRFLPRVVHGSCLAHRVCVLADPDLSEAEWRWLGDVVVLGPPNALRVVTGSERLRAVCAGLPARHRHTRLVCPWQPLFAQ